MAVSLTAYRGFGDEGGKPCSENGCCGVDSRNRNCPGILRGDGLVFPERKRLHNACLSEHPGWIWSVEGTDARLVRPEADKQYYEVSGRIRGGLIR